MNWEVIQHEYIDGFLIEFAIAPDDDDPRGHFATGDDKADAEIFKRIECGYYLWFVARVTASKAGVVLGTDYLGGCCYEAAKDFLDPTGYYPDMVQNAITEAKAKLKELAAP